MIRHAAGITRYQHAVRGLEQELTVSVDPDAPGQSSRASRSPTRRRKRGGSACSATSSGASARRGAASAGSWSPKSIQRVASSSRGTPTTRSSRRRVAFFHCHRGRPFIDLRSGRVHRPQQLAVRGRRRWRGKRSQGRARRRAGSVCGAADHRRNPSRRIEAGRVRARRGSRRAQRRATLAETVRPRSTKSLTSHRAEPTVLGRHARRDPGAHAGRFVRSAGRIAGCCIRP